MKLAFHQITSGSKRDLRETFGAYADAGWRHFEINLGETEPFVGEHGERALANLVKEYDLTCVGATGLSIAAFQGENALKECRKRMEHNCAVMNALGDECRAIVIGGDTPVAFQPRAANSTGEELEKRDAEYRSALAQFAEAVGGVAAVAEKHGVRLALEVNWCGLARSFRTMAELVRLVDRPNVGATWDPAHFFSTPSRLSDLDSLEGRIFHAHMNDIRNCFVEAMDINGDRVIPGDGILPLEKWTEKVRSLGYDRWHCVELFSDDLWKKPVGEIARDVKAGCRRLWPDAEF